MNIAAVCGNTPGHRCCRWPPSASCDDFAEALRTCCSCSTCGVARCHWSAADPAVERGREVRPGHAPPLPGEPRAHRASLPTPALTGLWQVSGGSDPSGDDSQRIDVRYGLFDLDGGMTLSRR